MNLARKIWAGCTAAAVLAGGHATAAESPQAEARVTRIIRDVKVLPSESSARPAVVNDKVREGTGVRTGDESRSELTFADLTISRLGANTIFSFNKAGRSVQLTSGSILLRVPKDSGGGNIRTNAVTVAVTGTTVIFESTRAGRSKLIILEGGARMALVKHSGQSAYLRAGQMLDVKAGATTLPPPVEVDLNQVMKTSPLITDFPPLPSQGLILAAIRDQASQGGGPVIYQGRPVAGQPGGSAWPPLYPGGAVGLPPGRPSGGSRGNDGRPGKNQPGGTTAAGEEGGSQGGGPTGGTPPKGGGQVTNPARGSTALPPRTTRNPNPRPTPRPTPRVRKPSKNQPTLR